MYLRHFIIMLQNWRRNYFICMKIGAVKILFAQKIVNELIQIEAPAVCTNFSPKKFVLFFDKIAYLLSS